ATSPQAPDPRATGLRHGVSIKIEEGLKTLLLQSKKWIYYTSPAGRNKIQDELRDAKLSAYEVAKLQLLMERLAEGQPMPQDGKALRDGVCELRAKVGQRSFRLAYAEVDDGLVLLALHFFFKKSQVARHDIDLAVDRLKDWRARQ
ncbi:MAG: type II toxin-antitoxin system RelE/ParE family toxin, partial [Pseudonocardiaceae bacterium]